jgi:tRNA A-37 threonylcarbamoyl transferase component Bud32/Tfp pilus assembly protein PilF
VFPPDQTAELSTPVGRAPPRAEVANLAAESISEGRSEFRTPAKTGVWEEGAVINDRYTLERRLGSGSMGEVFLASDRLLKKHVALKVLRKDLAKSRATVRRFLREVALAHSVTHPNVVRIYDTGEADGLPYFSMEHLQGQTLDELIDAGRRRDDEVSNAPAMTLREIREISHEILSGLAAAHDAGIVHRDLKPANVMLTHRGAIVMDFGVAGFDSPGEAEPKPNPAEARSLVRTEAGTIFGSPAYMAPELWEGAPATVQSDLYSFGVMLYQMLSGRLPIEAPNAKVFLVKLREEKPTPVRQLRKDTPWTLALLVARCMRTEPEKRPVSAAAAANLVSPLRLRRRWIAAGVLVSAAAATAAYLLRGVHEDPQTALGLPDRVAVADLDAFVRSYDLGDYETAQRQIERLEARAPESAALVFWRATLDHELGDENRRWIDCETSGFDHELAGTQWRGNEAWQNLAHRACSDAYSLGDPVRAILDPDDRPRMPLGWLPLAVSDFLIPRLESVREPGPALTREAEHAQRLLAQHEAFEQGPVLALRWQLATMDLQLALGQVDAAASTLDTAIEAFPSAPLALARAAWFYTQLGDFERAEAYADEVRFDDPGPAIRLMLDEGRMREAMVEIDEYATRPGHGHPHHQGLIDMWCGYAFRYQLKPPPLRCMEMSPGLVHNLWIGTRNEADNRAMNLLEKAIISQQYAIDRGECLSRGQSTGVIGHAPASFETYMVQLDITAALCRSGQDGGADIALARSLADQLLASTPSDPWALLVAAQVDEVEGRTADARDKQRRAAARWTKADADLPLVIDLRKLLGEPKPEPEPAAPIDEGPRIELEGEDVAGGLP